jgi:hypothetical protein
MSELHVSSTVGVGTTVRAVKWLKEPRWPYDEQVGEKRSA